MKKKIQEKVLVVVAHPDDAEISMGMKILDLKNQGHYVHVHCLSKGGKKNNNAAYKMKREYEATKAGSILNVDKYTFSDFPDTLFEKNSAEIRSELEEIIKTERPDAVYTHYHEDSHIDHEISSKETLIASRSVKSLVYFRSPYSRNFIPKIFYFADENSMNKKYKALKCFKSQRYLDEDFLKQISSVLYFEYLHPQLIINLKLSHGKKISDPLYCEFFIPERVFEVESTLPRLKGVKKKTFEIKEKVRFSLKNS